MPLPTCECVTGMPIGEQLGYIYCALVQILNNGGGGGSVNISDVEGVSDFWKATLGGTPAANQVFATDAAGVFTTLDYAEGGEVLLNLAVPGADSYIILKSDANFDTQTIGATASQTPVTQVDVSNGIVTAIS